MSEYTPSEFELEHKKEILQSVLKDYSIDFPDKPNPKLTGPREWLLRAESNWSRLIKSEDSEFHPTSGSFDKFGVYFGDNMQPLMYPNQGVYYVMRTDAVKEISGDFLSMSSPEYTKIWQEIVEEYKLNPKTISGGYEAGRKIYENYNTYEPVSGIATVHTSLSILNADKVIVSEDILKNIDQSKILPELKNKIVPLGF